MMPLPNIKSAIFFFPSGKYLLTSEIILAQQSDHYQTAVKSIMAAAFNLPKEQLADDLAFGDIPQWDSLGHMDLLMALEQHFGFELDADLIAELTSIDAICRYLKEEQNA
jgi:acyl carrier protein